MKTINKIISLISLSILSLCLALPVQAEESEGVPYTRMYTDSEGVSHFEDGFLALDELQMSEGEVAGIHLLETQDEITLMSIPPGMVEDWHPSPDQQILVVVQGIAEVGVSDGETRQFGPGEILLMEDTGVGHTTRTVGNESHIALMIPKR